MMKFTDSSRSDSFEGFNFEGFWDEGEYSLQNYHEAAPDDALLEQLRSETGYRPPDAWVSLARRFNGGRLQRSCFPTDSAAGFADDYITVHGIHALGRTARYSVGGAAGTRYMEEEWGYPKIGLVLADTPSAGHELIMLDYRDCGPDGEPKIVHVDQECGYRTTVIAADFVSFIRGLVDEDDFLDSSEAKEIDLVIVERGTLSPIVARALDASRSLLPEGEVILRSIARRIVMTKGLFALHADEDSQRLYDLMFWLYSQLSLPESLKGYLKPRAGQSDYSYPCYELMLPFSLSSQPYGFCTGGYAESFLEDWWALRVNEDSLIQSGAGWCFSEGAEAMLLNALREELRSI